MPERTISPTRATPAVSLTLKLSSAALEDAAQKRKSTARPRCMVRVFYASVRLLQIWAVIAVIALSIHLGGFPLLDPDEGGDAEAWLAFIATLASPLSVAFSRTVIFDSALAFFIAVAMMGFYLAIEGEERFALLAWIAIGLGVITKGPVAIALPLLVAIPYAIARKRVGAIFPLLGIVLFAAVIAPWVWAISRAVPDFLNYVLVVETTQRLTTGA